MPDNKGRSVSDAGYEVRQLDGGDQYDANLTMGGRPTSVSSNADSSVEAREMAANEEAREARRKIIAILEEDDGPPLRSRSQQAPQGHVRRKNPVGLSLDDLSEGLDMHIPNLAADHGMDANDMAALAGGLNDAMNSTAVDLMQQGYTGEDNEAAQMVESMAGRPQVPAEPTWDWVAAKGMATLRSGKKVPVWTVENKASGMGMNKPFRIQSPAERIAALLNIAGNVNDPRIKQIHEDYDTYVGLTKQLRQAKKLYESGDQGAGRTGQKIAAQLRGIKQRLGI